MAKKSDTISFEEKLQTAIISDWEQPYQVPKNWVWTRLGYVSNLFTGNSINTRVKDEKYRDQIKGLDYIGTKDVGFDNNITYDNGIRIPDYENFKTAPANTALLCIEGGSAGRKIGFTAKEVCFGNKLCAFVCKKSDPKLIYYYLQSEIFSRAFTKEHHGLIGGVSVALLNNIAIPFPPIAEQMRIVAWIESLFAKLDEAKGLTQSALDSLETRKAAILHQAFTGALTTNWRKENGVGMESWLQTKVEKILDSIKYGTSEKSDYQYGGLAVFRIPNIGDKKLLYDDIKYLQSKELPNEDLLRAGDILVIRSNGSKELVGKCALVPELDRKYGYASFLIRLRVSSEITPNYMVWFLSSSDARSQMFKKAKSSAGINNINSKEIGDINISVPSIKEQVEIVRILDSLFEKEQKAKELYDVIDKIDLIKKAVLARAFRGELGTNDPNDEPAIELLKECLLVNYDVNDKSHKAKNKSISIPREIDKQLKSSLEREIYSLLLRKNAAEIKEIMVLNRNTFDVIEALKRLEEKKLVFKHKDGSYSVG